MDAARLYQFMNAPLVIRDGTYRGFYLFERMLFLPEETRPYVSKFECIIKDNITQMVFFTATPSHFTHNRRFIVAPQCLQDEYAYRFGGRELPYSNGVAFEMRSRPELFQTLNGERLQQVLSYAYSSPASIVQSIQPEQEYAEPESPVSYATDLDQNFLDQIIADKNFIEKLLGMKDSIDDLL
tara:strand:- start:2592 stop:3140 length:549 start_codon:yes stop_codon:yes gene_type:complete